MGLLTLRRSPALPEWTPARRGITTGGDRSDLQCGESLTVRFTCPAKPGSLIDVTFYPVEYPDGTGLYRIERMTEWIICTDPADPGGTEVWSDLDITTMPDRYSSPANASFWMWAMAEEAETFPAAYTGWDGEVAPNS